MSVRSATVTKFVTSQTSRVANFGAVASGDRAWAVYSQDVNGQTITPPTGWTQRVDLDLTGPDQETILVFTKDAVCTGSETSATWTTSATYEGQIIIVVESGRDSATSPLSATGTPTKSTASNASPISTSAGGVTALASDDLRYVVGLDPTSGTAGTYALSSVTAGFSKIVEDSCAWNSVAIWGKDAVSAGATGTVSGTATGGASAGYAAVLLAFKAGAATAASDVIPTAQSQRVAGNPLLRMAPQARRKPGSRIYSFEGIQL